MKTGLENKYFGSKRAYNNSMFAKLTGSGMSGAMLHYLYLESNALGRKIYSGAARIAETLCLDKEEFDLAFAGCLKYLIVRTNPMTGTLEMQANISLIDDAIKEITNEGNIYEER